MAAADVATTVSAGRDSASDHHPDADIPSPSTVLNFTVTHSGSSATLLLPPDATVEDLSLLCQDQFSEEKRHGGSDAAASTTDAPNTLGTLGPHKFLAPPPVGVLYGDRDAATPLASVIQRIANASSKKRAAGPLPGTEENPLKLRLLVSSAQSVQSLRQAGANVQQMQARLADLRRRTVPLRQTTPRSLSSPASGSYTFHDIRPLAHLPRPERSLAYLHRLRDDPGIRQAMAAHRFQVGLLTEMDPLLYTEVSHEGTSRTLGLNRNQGQVIELRLRTDAGDGYRDYRTVRRTLCHELAHNVYGPHDADFWRLCHQLEREVEAVAQQQAQARSGGRSLAGYGTDDYYEPPTPSTDSPSSADDDHTDAGGWTGGAFVLGSGAVSTGPTAAAAAATARGIATTTVVTTPGQQREQRARAAEARLRRGGSSSGNGGSGSEPKSSSRSASGEASGRGNAS